MKSMTVVGKQKGYTVFSARRNQDGVCGLISVGAKGAFSRKK